MKRLLTKGLLALAIAASWGTALCLPIAHAQDVADNLETVGDQSGLGSEDIKIIIANLIRTGLTFLGVVALCIVLYGGFVWMTASGDTEKVDRAKKILINGGIGLVIILMAWSITTFIMRSVLDATGAGSGNTENGGGPGIGGTGPGGSASLFEVTGISPEGTQTIRNIQVQITFSASVLDTSITNAITVTNVSTGEEVAGTLSASGKRVTFIPSGPCPSPNEDRFCFDENTEYSVLVSEDVESTSGVSLTCTTDSCAGSFTSGTLVDTEDPRANMTAPDDHDAVSVDAEETVEAEGTDDAGVATADFSVDGGEAFESVTASGDDLTNVVMQGIWNTAGLTTGETYEVSVTVTDVAGNTDTDAVTVTARPATCFNGVQDEDMGETDVDCGGERSSSNYCGACQGSSCTESSDCGGSATCENGICSDVPTIESISPDNGAEGTFVTISGSGFGNDAGQVFFSQDDGTPLAADIASCSDGWSDNEIIAVVPDGAADGPLSIITSRGDEEHTNDEQGELIPDFDVNDIERPSLCSITPRSGMAAEAFVLSGSGFGNSRGSSTVNFGDNEEAGSYTNWSDTSITGTVPTANEGDYSVFVTANDVESNPVTFEVTKEASTDAPNIVRIDPEAGGPGQYITITGSSFGSTLGSVWFTSQMTGERTQGSIDFPSECDEDIWSDTEITVIVPEIAGGNYAITVESRSGESSPVMFVVNSDEPTPGLCAISPDNGDVGDAIMVYGDNFGTSTGTVHFAGGVTATPTSWEDKEAQLVVPEGAITGSLKVVSAASQESNERTFTVGSDTSTTSSRISAAYAWSFSSGDIPDVPEVVVACTETQVSAVPNDRFSDEVCLNAQVYVEFTVDMNEATLNNALTVEKCTAAGDDPCDETDPVRGAYETTTTSVTFSPDDGFDVSTTYQVTVSTAAMSADGSPLAQNVSWTFTTKSDDTACEVERVVVSPDAATIDAKGDTQAFSALPIANCTVLNADDFVWSWNMNESYAHFTSGTASSNVIAEALAEGTTDVTAQETESEKEGVGVLTVNFSDPFITQYFPDCTEACTNANVGATFNVPMDSVTVESGAELYLCANELCTSLTEVVGTTVGCTENENGECIGFMLTTPSTLTAGAYYRVIASGAMESESGVQLIRTNYGEDFSWMFRVQEDGTVCAVERVAVSPSSAQSSEIGDQKVFTAEAYGEADSCSVSGQLLNAFSYAWSWENPIDDEDNDSNGTTVVAAWRNTGFADTDPTSIPEGCTTSCTAAGSAPYNAVCGDGVLETDEGEECEDGNVASGDGCSSSCLREGDEAVTYACSGGGASCSSLADDATCTETCDAGVCSISAATCTTRSDCAYASSTCNAVGIGCGDGSIADNEDCDDGNTIDGDGCSAECLAEGSSAIGATCGNNDVAYDITTYAGEECDDGNATNNDGCSASCTNEGSPTLASIGGAICGDGTVDEPYEACDDNNTDDNDGCSSACLYEGSSLSYTTPSTCGDGVIGTGEECEDGNDASGDGCSADCVLEGASASYGLPSYCGDGVGGTGEVAACEVGAGGDGHTDPVQVATIDDSAVFEVDSETGKATATIRATESSSTFTGESTWTLFCAATSDSDCEDPATQGVGTGNCCMDRPTVSLTPANGASNICRNAALYGTFTEPMDVESFTYETTDGDTSYHMYAALDLSSTSDGLCPSTHTTLAQAPSGFFARAWRTIQSWIFGARALAATGDCVVPLESFRQEEVNGEYLVYMNTTELLYAGGRYTLVVEGDGTITDETVEGVASRYGVGINGNSTATFTVGSDICAADAVQVTDTDEDSPNIFSSLDDEHTFAAAAISYSTGSPQEIAAIAGVYDWTWSSWESDNEDVLTATLDSTNLDHAIVAPAGENGTANILATLTIQNNTSGIETESSVSGYTEATALLCENPWPAIESYPWTDDESWTGGGSEEGIGWMHFSLGYCRDTTGTETDDDGEQVTVDATYPELTVISPNDPQDDAILKEYIFKVQGTSDAIGVRIASNPNYLSPMAWYEAQGFAGTPSETTIDGFPAVEDGRTTYIAAPNLDEDGNYLYSNMYIISYNDNAGDDAEEIYSQMIENFALGTNLSSVGYCSDGSAYTTECTSDLNCDTANGESCADLKGKLARDTKRLADMTDLRTAIETYGEDSGYCSETTSAICSKDSDCPGSETCVAGVPTLPSGTYVHALASSVWGSWTNILGGALDEDIASDPLNVYEGCGSSPYEDYDAETCVDETHGIYVCPENSHAYHYQAYGTEYAYVYADLEYANADWYYPIDPDGTDDNTTILIGNSSGFADGFATAAFCDGSAYGSGGTCGDGIINTSIDSNGDGTAETVESCEIGESGGTSEACDSDGDGINDGYINQICNSSCTAFENNASATCTPASCGDGVVEGDETCDDGTANGRYGYCGSDCTYDTAVFCGDGELSGGELCDCGDADVFGTTLPSTGRAYGASSVGSCTEFNGEYNASPSVSCAWDCSGAASYCGDGEITGSEQCDGEDDTWDGELCSGGSDDGDPCTTGSDCSSGTCGGSGSYAACTTGFTRVLACDDTAGASCTYTGNWKSTACTEIGSCGDGIVDPDEECDDGNTDGTDSCTTDCTQNICGDGYVYSGEEECDEGEGNGTGCDASYGSTCSACTTSCRTTVSSGAFCGDGIINGSEYCDGSDIPYQYFDTGTGASLVHGACTAGDPTFTDESGNVYTCRRIGMCDGGPENGEYCTSSTGGLSGSDRHVCNANGLTAVSCVFPSCADSCASSCPLAETANSLLMTPNLPGSAESSSADLYSYSSDSTSDLPNAATITMPACTVAGTLTGTINISDVDLPDAYVLFVTDRSGSMSTALGTSPSTRMSVARDLLSTSVTALYEGLGEDMHIGLEGFSNDAGTGICTGTNTYSCNSDDDCSSEQTCENELTDTLDYGFGGPSDEATLQSRILEFTQSGSTYTGAALTEAKSILDAIPDDGNVRKIVVLLSDGDPTDSPSSAATALKSETTANGESYELYTVALTTSSTLISNMNSWSSNDGAAVNDNGIDYAYDGDTVAELEFAYQSIIDSILGITVSVISSNGSTAELTTSIVNQGNNVSLPWPENFTCDPESDQEVPIQITFLGEGTVNLSNLRIQYCAP